MFRIRSHVSVGHGEQDASLFAIIRHYWHGGKETLAKSKTVITARPAFWAQVDEDVHDMLPGDSLELLHGSRVLSYPPASGVKKDAAAE